MSFMPNAAKATIDPPKLQYLLTTGKAQFFILHGFDPSRPEQLADALHMHPLDHEYESVVHSVHGVKYTVRCSLRSPDGRNPCALSVWIVDAGASTPRLVTAYASPV